MTSSARQIQPRQTIDDGAASRQPAASFATISVQRRCRFTPRATPRSAATREEMSGGSDSLIARPAAARREEDE